MLVAHVKQRSVDAAKIDNRLRRRQKAADHHIASPVDQKQVRIRGSSHEPVDEFRRAGQTHGEAESIGVRPFGRTGDGRDRRSVDRPAQYRFVQRGSLRKRKTGRLTVLRVLVHRRCLESWGRQRYRKSTGLSLPNPGAPHARTSSQKPSLLGLKLARLHNCESCATSDNQPLLTFPTFYA